MDNNNNQPLVQPVQQPQIPPVDPQMGQPVQQPQIPPVDPQMGQPVQQPVYQQPVQQPVYQPLQPDPNQPAYMYQPPYQPQTQYVQGNNATLGIQQADLYTPAEQSERRKKANILCIISLVCQFAPEVLAGIFSGIVESIDDLSSNSSLEPLTYLSSTIVFATYVASWVLMIIARVKYKESKFAKVLMWVYIGILAASVIALILVIAMCAYMLKDCQGF
jgi:hypothetical protein